MMFSEESDQPERRSSQIGVSAGHSVRAKNPTRLQAGREGLAQLSLHWVYTQS